MTERIRFIRGFMHGQEIILDRPSELIRVPHVKGVWQKHIQRQNHRGELYLQPCCGLGHEPRKQHSVYKRHEQNGKVRGYLLQQTVDDPWG